MQLVASLGGGGATGSRWVRVPTPDHQLRSAAPPSSWIGNRIGECREIGEENGGIERLRAPSEFIASLPL